MRLINVSTLALEEFVGEAVPDYAILSHTWEAEEVSLAEYTAQNCQNKKGYEKVKAFCRLARTEGFRYGWVDTCCIDKTSSAELSEAINSMFQWYRDATVCYAYLADVDSAEDAAAKDSSFASSRWFTRGWTLQELLAPVEVVFLGGDWVEIGTKKSLRDAVSAATGIDHGALKGSWSGYSVAQKMSWAAGRKTTRLEDEAYCLMGLFDVNLPLLYGEGRKAFSRLQQEILKTSEDQSIFAWSYPKEQHSRAEFSGLLASSPECFREASRIEVSEDAQEDQNPFEIVNRLVRIQLRLFDGIMAMELRTCMTEPYLCEVVQIRQNGTRERELSELSASSTRIQATDISEYGIKTKRHPSWVWYIYEPVIVAPLRCRVQGRPLAILLSRSVIQGTGPKALSRLHNPSLVATNMMEASLLTPLTTAYAAMATSTTQAIKPDDKSAYERRYSWPNEIRIAGTLAAGYICLEDCGHGWTLELDRVLQQPKASTFMFELEEEKFTPLMVFCHESGDDTAHPTFFVTFPEYSLDSQDGRSEGLYEIYVGIYRPGTAALSMFDYQLFSLDLVGQRRVQVPLGNGQYAVIKLREGPTVSFASISVEMSRRERVEEEPNGGGTRWLNARLRPMLRILPKRPIEL